MGAVPPQGRPWHRQGAAALGRQRPRVEPPDEAANGRGGAFDPGQDMGQDRGRQLQPPVMRQLHHQRRQKRIVRRVDPRQRRLAHAAVQIGQRQAPLRGRRRARSAGPAPALRQALCR
jgi:hypothetical protein